MSIFTRLHNLWLWSEYEPNFVMSPSEMKTNELWTGIAKERINQLGEEMMAKVMAAEIIYPDKVKEFMRSEKEPTLDDIIDLNEKS